MSKRNSPQRAAVLHVKGAGYFDIIVKKKQTAKSSCSFSKALVVLKSMSKRNRPQRSAVLFQTRWLF